METLMQPVEPASESQAKDQGRQPEIELTKIRIKGIPVSVPSVQIGGRKVIIKGKWLRVASIQDEELMEGETVADPALFVKALLETAPTVDLFTFAQKVPHSVPRHAHHLEWENVAVIPITTYAEWWEKRTDPGVRRAVRKAAKAGIVVKVAEFDDEFVRGIVGINNETPIRQGKRFWHYQKSFEAVKQENSTFADRNVFLGAYWQDELIGFVRLTRVDSTAHMLQILSMTAHYDKRPANALVAKAVETCEKMGISYLAYANYVYNDPKSSLTEFKRRNGFERMVLPRYYVPLTLRGKVALSVGFHRGAAQSIPKPLLLLLLRIRARWYAHKLKVIEEPARD